jgi:hypothetical protein
MIHPTVVFLRQVVVIALEEIHMGVLAGRDQRHILDLQSFSVAAVCQCQAMTPEAGV